MNETVAVRPEETDLRVMQSNVKDDGLNNDPIRADLLFRTYIAYAPDVITFNELNPRDSKAEGNIPLRLKQLLEPYYTILDGAEYLPIFSEPEKPDFRVAQRKFGFPVAYRKNAGLTLIDSAFSYHTRMEYFHGTAWAVLEKNGFRFLVAANHLAENVTVDENGVKTTSTVWVEQVMQVLRAAKDRHGELPMILNGDWYFARNLRADVYQYMLAQGLNDTSQSALVKCSEGIGTFHNLGEAQTNWAHEDIIFASTGAFRALRHEVVVNDDTIRGSDHYPVVADLQFIR